MIFNNNYLALGNDMFQFAFVGYSTVTAVMIMVLLEHTSIPAKQIVP